MTNFRISAHKCPNETECRDKKQALMDVVRV